MTKETNKEIHELDSAEIQQRKARMMELAKMLPKARLLSLEEYKLLLYEIRNNYTIFLAMRSISGSTSDTGAYSTVVERMHYLINTIEGKPSQRVAIDHKIQTSKLDEIRDMLLDPNNLGDVLHIEGLILEKLTDA